MAKMIKFRDFFVRGGKSKLQPILFSIVDLYVQEKLSKVLVILKAFLEQIY